MRCLRSRLVLGALLACTPAAGAERAAHLAQAMDFVHLYGLAQPRGERERYVFSLDGKRVVDRGEDPTLTTYDLEARTVKATSPFSAAVRHHAFGHRLAFVVDADGSARVHDMIAGRDLDLPIGDGAVSGFFSIDDRFLGVTYQDRSTRIFDLSTKESFPIAQGADVKDHWFFGPRVLRLGERYFDLKTREEITEAVRTGGGVLEGRRDIYAGGAWLTLREGVFDLDERRVAIGPPQGGPSWKGRFGSVYSDGGKFAFVRPPSGPAAIYDLRTKKPVAEIPGGLWAEFSPAEDGAAVIGLDGSARYFELSGGGRPPLPLGESVHEIDSSHLGGLIVVRYQGGSGKAFDVRKGEELALPLGASVKRAMFSPRDNLMIVRPHQGQARLIDLRTRREVKVPATLTGYFGRDYFSSDESLLFLYGESPRGGYQSYARAIDLALLESPLVEAAIARWKDSAELGFHWLSELTKTGAIQGERTFEDWYSFLLGLVEDLHALTTDYNRPSLLELFEEHRIVSFLHEKGGDIRSHLGFYRDILGANKRLAVTVLEGVFEAVKSGELPVDLDAPEKETIARFIGRTNGFSAPLYQVYKKEGEAGLSRILAFGERLLKDDAGPEDMSRFEADLSREGYDGPALLLAVMQKAVPTSGASFVKRADIRGLADKYRAAGDRRGDISGVWRNLGAFDPAVIEKVEWRLRPEEAFDPQKKISALLAALRFAGDSQSQDEDRRRFLDELGEYLSDQGAPGRERALGAFLAYAGHDDLLREKIDRVQPDDYVGLDLLDHLFRDKDNLPMLLRRALEDEYKQGGARPVGDPARLKRALLGLWGKQAPEEAKRAQLGRLLSGADEGELRRKVLTPELPPALREAAGRALSGKKTLPITVDELARALFSAPLATIEAEKAKFERAVSPESTRLSFRAVKGPGFALHGLCSGVCIAPDLQLWKKKEFALLALVDETRQEAVGFVHLFAVERDGKKILTAPGIEPSVEFLGRAKAAEVYPLIERALGTLAEAGGFDEVYVPTHPNIASNRKDVQDLIAKRGYPKAKLSPAVEWNTVPQAYPFEEAYVVWSRSRAR